MGIIRQRKKEQTEYERNDPMHGRLYWNTVIIMVAISVVLLLGAMLYFIFRGDRVTGDVYCSKVEVYEYNDQSNAVNRYNKVVFAEMDYVEEQINDDDHVIIIHFKEREDAQDALQQ